jgi:hypothetical protein
MRIASFNVENLFERAKALNLDTWAQGRQALERHAQINQLLNKASYSAADKARIVELLTALGLDKSDDGHEFARLRQNRGKLLKRPRSGPLQIVANGRDDWIGWVELKTEHVDELASRHTAMVIQQVDADVLGVVEAEDRVALKRFSDFLLAAVGAMPYAHVMVIDGNDDRGIDVGLMTKTGFDVVAVRSHVDDDGQGLVFSRDCPEYLVTAPSGERLVVLVNHLKSKASARPRIPTRAGSARRNVWPRSTSGCAPTANGTSRCSATSTTRPTRRRWRRYWRTPTSRTSRCTPASSATAGRAHSATAPRATRSTMCCSRRSCSPTSPAARSSAWVSGAAYTERCSRTSRR